MIRSVIKRDGRVVLYDEAKIAAAILKAMEAAHEGDATDAARIANEVAGLLETENAALPPQIEHIQENADNYKKLSKQYK